MFVEFKPFPKIPRLSREIIITEKIDGTNAGIFIDTDGTMLAASRTRWITPDNDNFGFAAWVHQNKEELLKLGHGMHWGEWWGRGIQRGYGKEDRSFSLFNTSRWIERGDLGDEKQEPCPDCCLVVPTLYRGVFSEQAIMDRLAYLSSYGSVAKPGFMQPEGVTIYHTAAGIYFKKLLENDELPKGNK